MNANVTAISERLATLSIGLRRHAENVEADLEQINGIVRSMGEAGLLSHYVQLGPTYSQPYAPDSRRDEAGQIVQAALLVPEGFGVCYWDVEEFESLRRSPEGLEPDARLQFHPFEQCTEMEKAFLGPFIEGMLEELHEAALAAAARLEEGIDLSVDEYFGGGSRANGNDNP